MAVGGRVGGLWGRTVLKRASNHDSSQESPEQKRSWDAAEHGGRSVTRATVFRLLAAGHSTRIVIPDG